MPPMFSIKVSKIPVLKLPNLIKADTNKIGEYLITSMKERVKRGIGVNDSPMPRYSLRRIYVPINGKGMGKARTSVTKKLKAFRKAGLPVGRTKKSGTYVTSSGQSISFPNRAAYKKVLGRSGKRDIWETGLTQRSIAVTSSTSKSIVISVMGDVASKRADYNQRIAEWFGASNKDAEKTLKIIEDLYDKAVEKENGGA